MKAAITHVKKLYLTELDRLDPVTVILEDIEPGKGKLIIECYGRSWSAYWGSISKPLDVASFVETCSTDYLVGSLSTTRQEIDDVPELIRVAKRELLRARKYRKYGEQEAREYYDILNDFDDETNPHHIDGVLSELIHDEWFMDIPTKICPEYEYICRIVDAVKAGIKLSRSL